MTDEARIRERAHRLWLEEGKPEGRELEHWREAERQLRAEAGDKLEPTPPDHGPVDPVRNPVPIRRRRTREYPAITGPEEMPAGRLRARALTRPRCVDGRRGARQHGKLWSARRR